ncbi:hypothetical protein [Microbacterium imperiale]|uniref:Uncharacterized protein n=1 Tax=Microbacterium imperiale TaxID=33884 RepID=A0A9W6HDS8_9MICO|nr:hypothetical protein [Microbacterium imperiale]MBP2420034.1 hypothetical protein [Microbacterium imperiale]MDS0198103.1 hypothetical protein [Microbacterium imperiale]BFE40375.1 hypothetical protein GCM10017544_13310 [Microbacterium imperiale]GLJ78649.1 hypothetical protein GCM10017586_03310 [Microbacterium imperiale]
MSDAIKVTVSDPESGEELESRVIDNDFMVLCAGDRYIDGVQAYANGTQIVTVKRRTNHTNGSTK